MGLDISIVKFDKKAPLTPAKTTGESVTIHVGDVEISLECEYFCYSAIPKDKITELGDFRGSYEVLELLIAASGLDQRIDWCVITKEKAIDLHKALADTLAVPVVEGSIVEHDNRTLVTLSRLRTTLAKAIKELDFHKEVLAFGWIN